jgi:formylglycine-generating enzyme required for sulfatase activity
MKKMSLILVGAFCAVALVSFTLKSEGLKLSKNFKKSFAYLPSSKVVVDGKAQEVATLYIQKTEVSNAEYNQFLTDAKSAGRMSVVEIASIDNNQWENVCNNKPLSETYQGSKQFAEHPAVNMSYEGAVAYCNWKSDQLNTQDVEHHYEVRLPTRAEWVRAAEGNWHGVAYSWGGPFARNERGCQLGQFEKEIPSNGLFDELTFTCPIYSYSPNSVGLYCMNGNVAEMTQLKGEAVGGSWQSSADDVRNASVSYYSQANPMLGFRPVVIVSSK